MSKATNEEHNDICTGVITHLHSVGHNDVCVVAHPAKNNGPKVACRGTVKLGDVHNGPICLNAYEDDFSHRTKVLEARPSKVEGVSVGPDTGGSVGDPHNVGTCTLPSENGSDNLLVEIHSKDLICKLVNHIDILNGEPSVNVLSSTITCRENGVMEEEKSECTTI